MASFFSGINTEITAESTVGVLKGVSTAQQKAKQAAKTPPF